MKRLYPPQEAHVRRLVSAINKHNAALDASDTGTGKTICAVEIIKGVKAPHLIVCPKAVIPSWTRELTEAGVEPCVVNYEKLRAGNTPYGKWNRTKWAWSIPNDSVIVWDECQKLQGVKSQNAKIAMASKAFGNLMLSATAAEDPLDMKATGFLLGLHHGYNFWNWAKEYGCAENPWGGLVFDGNPKHLLRLHGQIFPGHGSRMRIADLSEFFSDNQIITEPMDFGDDGTIRAIYAEMEAELDALEEAKADDSKDPSARALILQLRARQKAELLKVPLFSEMALQHAKEGKSVAIFVNFEATLQALREKLPDCRVIHGGQSAKAREGAIQDFQTNSVRFIVVNVAAGGVGVSLHDLDGNYPRVALISPSFNAKEILQTLGRIHRAGGKSSCLQYILFAPGTVEERVVRSMAMKIENMKTLNDGQANASDVTCSNAQILRTSDLMPSTPPTAEERGHARFSPSTFKTRELCPSWENDNSPSKSTFASDEGSMMHDAYEKEDYSRLNKEQEEMVHLCVVYTRQFVAPTSRVIKEECYDVLDQFGYVDRLIINGSKAHLLDAKFGHVDVDPAEKNAQMQGYCLGIWDKHPEVEEITVHLLIPRLGKISRHTYTRARDYATIRFRISAIIERSKHRSGKEHNASFEACEYCGNKGDCPAFAVFAKQFHGKHPEGLAWPEDIDPVTVRDPQTISTLLRMAPLFESWASQVRDYALSLNMEEGLDIPGFRRCERSSARMVNSVPGAWDVVKETFPEVSVEDFITACSKVSIPELETLVAASAPRGKKGNAKQTLENALRDNGILNEQSTVFYLKPVKNQNN